MKRLRKRCRLRYLLIVVYVLGIVSILGIVIFTNCSSEPIYIADSQEQSLYLANDKPFQFPLKKIRRLTGFDSFKGAFKNQHHAAEDFKAKAGTPVYAVADGKVSFSGRVGGYGWLVIIDHFDWDVYSLYGHLSERRWKIKSGAMVKKGENIGYIADDDEDGSGGSYPEWSPHLHFGIRKGQRSDYPNSGDNRWMAGYTVQSSSQLNWLQPSKFIKNFRKK
jgi:murein DD-endopeptidase MepM/ murein hydrolase activator NlpD